jgi:hypothetical protein
LSSSDAARKACTHAADGANAAHYLTSFFSQRLGQGLIAAPSHGKYLREHCQHITGGEHANRHAAAPRM